MPFFFFNDTATTEIYPLSLHDALPISGPARVQALVLIRAPGWPLGPGDAEAGLAAARRAVALPPLYPPNLLALAEAVAETGDSRRGLEKYLRARDAALALPAAPHRGEWLRVAGQGLQRT